MDRDHLIDYNVALLLATTLGHLLRCMYYRDGRCCPDGRCKSSWIARTFGVDIRNVKAALEKSANLGKPISPEVIVIATNMEEPGRLADLTASNLDLKVEGAQEILDGKVPQLPESPVRSPRRRG